MKKCPFCAEEIQNEAIVCRYCGRELDPHRVRDITIPFQEPDTKEPLPKSKTGSSTGGEASWASEVVGASEARVKKRGSAIGRGLLIGFLLAVFAGIYQLIDYYNCISSYGGDSLACHGIFLDLQSHFLSNFLFWTLIIIGVTYVFRKEWKNVGLTLLALVIAILLLTLTLGIHTGILDFSSLLPQRTGISTPTTTVSDHRSLVNATRTSTPPSEPNGTIPQVETTSEENCNCPWGNFEEVSNLASGTEICVSGRVSTQGQIGYLYWVEHKGTDEWRKAFIRLKNLPFYYDYFAPDTIVDLQGVIGRDEDGKTIISVDIADIRVCK